MSAAASQMGAAAGELIGRIGAIAPSGVLMPPALEVEAAETVVSVAGDLVASAQFYAANAIDLAGRVALVIAENAGGGVELGAVFSLLREGGLLGGGSFAETLFPGGFKSELERLNGDREVIGEVTGWVDTASELINNTPLSFIERVPAFGQDVMGGIEQLEANGAYNAFGKVLAGADAGIESYSAWQDTQGEVTVARLYTTVATGGADYVINRIPVTAGANALSGGILEADANILIQIDGGAMSGAIRGYEEHGIIGVIPGALQGANQQWNNAANEAAQGKFGTPVKWVSQGVNWAVDKAYGPVSNAIGDVSHAVSHTAHVAEHLADGAVHQVGRGIKDLEHIF